MQQIADMQKQITIERRFDIWTDFNEDWFRSYVGQLTRYTVAPEVVDCEVRLYPDLDNCIKFRHRNSWVDFVIKNWNDVAESSIWQGRNSTISRARCHHFRHTVIFSVAAESVSAVEQTYEQLCGALSLSASKNLPYKYRRSSVEFEVGNWRPDLFVIGVKQIAGLLGSNPDLVQAYAKSFEGDVEKLTSFFDLQSFCDDVGTRASRFGEIVIRMDARSTSVGIGVPSDHKKLRIRTSIAPNQLDNIIGAWPDGLKLTPIKATDTGADAGGAAPPVTENTWLKHGVPVAVAFITAASVAGLVNLKNAFWPDYKIVISTPIVEKGIAKWAGNKVSLNWYLQPEQPSFGAVRKDVAATVRVYAPSGLEPPIESKPPVELSLRPGAYLISVDVPDAAPVQFQLQVQTPSSK